MEKLIRFKKELQGIELPVNFTFPFYYEPHPLALFAAQELQEYLENQTDFNHNFGIKDQDPKNPIGKMFGVLVVQDKKGELGYLAAFSGKLANSNEHTLFVPPVFDILKDYDFFRKVEKEIDAITAQLITLENSEEHLRLKNRVQQVEKVTKRYLQIVKSHIKRNKTQRTSLRSNATETEQNLLNEQSKKEQYFLKFKSKQLSENVQKAKAELQNFTFELDRLRTLRAEKSSTMQQEIFDQYVFYNAKKEKKSLNAIFAPTVEQKPPAGAGECSAPKLLHFAFAHDLKPVAMAEFWWGASPQSEIRKHKQYYPACKRKCEPILGHMLNATTLDPNPMIEPLEKRIEHVEVLYKDDQILILNKPEETLSVPGNGNYDSLFSYVQRNFESQDGHYIVHRLDMSTSGILIFAFTKSAHYNLQRQFLKRKVKKRYVALLEGKLMDQRGRIELPLTLDFNDRPRQMVCHETGKVAVTEWEQIEYRAETNQTLVYFYPLTGRTHQLRVHAAHPAGLNSPILGDDLYGTAGKRLHLHAESIQFQHPKSHEIIAIQKKIDF